MQGAGPGLSLADMLATVHPLLASCVACWEEQAVSFRNLRLVSREICRTVQKSARTCSVQLGTKACLPPAQVVRLIRESQLEHLNVTIMTVPGHPHGPSVTKQVKACTSQLEEMLQGLRQAISSVTALTVRVTYQLEGKAARNAAKAIPCIPSLPPCCPASFADISRSVCRMLASAVPALQQLNIEGCCWDAALQSFGASCLQLTGLQLDPMTTSMLKGAGNAMRSMTCLTLKTRYRPFTDQLLSDHVADALSGINRSKSLSKVVLDLYAGFVLCCGSELQAPETLRELVSNCKFPNLVLAPKLYNSLHSLSLVMSGGFNTICAIIELAPNLQNVTGVGPSMLTMEEDTLLQIPFLRARLLAGLNLLVPSIKLLGARSIVQSLLAELPKLPGVLSCTLAACSSLLNQAPFPLTDVARVFPNLTELRLLDQSVHGVEGMSMQHLGCLATCTFLQRLTLRGALACSTADLVGLIQSIPSLESFGYLQCPGVNLKELFRALQDQAHFKQLYGHNVPSDRNSF